MATINSLIAGTSAYALNLDYAVNAQGGQKIATSPETKPASDGVVFERGQSWRNRAVKSKQVTAAEAGEGVAQAYSAAYATQAYQSQAGQAPNFPGNGEEGSGRSEGQPQPFDKSSSDAAQPEAGRQDGQEEASSGEATSKTPDGRPLTQEEKLVLTKLQQVDTQVRAHEMAHLAAAGHYARSGANFQYQRGPDGKSYAVGGEVQIDTSRESTPEATIRKMRVVRAAALAPADPSPQDRKVAAGATSAITAAVQELRMLAQGQAQADRQQTASEAGKVNESSGGDNAVGKPQGPYQGDARTKPTGVQTVGSSAAYVNSAARQRNDMAHPQHQGVSIVV